VVELIHGLTAARVRANLERVRAETLTAAEQAGRDPLEVEILAATKYVPVDQLPTLADAGIALVGENRAQDLHSKVAAGRSSIGGQQFTWDFIGALQSKHVRAIVPHVRLIHSLASDSALRELERHIDSARDGLRVLVQVNLAGDPNKAGIAPDQLDAFIARSPAPVAGLMTMPPLTHDPEQSRPWFRRLRQLAAERGLRELSMGTTQDFAVAVQEGATIVRIGTRLYS
jgi:pyridoxal phosphate enzyme (YggS family)